MDKGNYDVMIGNTPDLTEWSHILEPTHLSLPLPFPFTLEEDNAFPLYKLGDGETIHMSCHFRPQLAYLLRMQVLNTSGKDGEGWEDIQPDLDYLVVEGNSIIPMPTLSCRYLKFTTDERLWRNDFIYSCQYETFEPLPCKMSGKIATIRVKSHKPLKYIVGFLSDPQRELLNNHSSHMFPTDIIEEVKLSWRDYLKHGLHCLDTTNVINEFMNMTLLPNMLSQRGFFLIPVCVYPMRRGEDRCVVTENNQMVLELNINPSYTGQLSITALGVFNQHLVYSYHEDNDGQLVLTV
jgi:hypothetical protein